MLVYSCKSKPCNPDFFDRVDEYPQFSHIFKVDSLHFYRESLCAYRFRFRFWDTTSSKYQLGGRIFMVGQELFCLFESGQYQYLLMDFSNNGIEIPVEIPGGIHEGKYNSTPDSYFFLLEQKWYDKKYNDTIYKFRFKEMDITSGEYDVIMYVGKQVGWVGGYLGGFPPVLPGEKSDSTEYLDNFYGDIFLDTDKKYKRVIRKLIVL